MRKIILVCMLCGMVNTVEAQFWGGFLQGALVGTQNALRQQQIRQQQERERRAREEANRIEKELQIETGFKWYETKQNGKYGAEDYYHNTLIPLSRGYEFICFQPKEGHVGYFEVEKNGKEGACDITGKEVISTSYESVLYLRDSGFNYKNSSGGYVPTGWYLDSEGKATREVPVNKELKTEEDGFKWYGVRQGETYGAEDYLNRTLIPLSRQYSAIYYIEEKGHKGYFSVEKGDKEGACDLTGKEIIQPIHESVFYSNGFKYKNSAGEYIAAGWMLDSEGKGIRGTNESITYNGATYYIVSRDGLYGLTDANGKEIVAKEMEIIEDAGANNRLKFKQNGSWGLMNFLGKILVPTSRGYTSIGKYSKTQKTFAYTMYGYKGECDINGRQISKIRTSSTSDMKSNNANASNNSSSSSNVATSNEEHIISYDYYKSPSGNKIKGNYKFNIQFKNDAVYFKLTNTKKGNIIYNFKLKELYYSEVDNVLMIGFKDSKKSHVFLFKKGYYDPVEHIETNLITNKETITSYFQDKEDATSVLGMTILMGTTPTEIFFDRIFEELSFYQGGCKIRLIDK